LAFGYGQKFGDFMKKEFNRKIYTVLGGFLALAIFLWTAVFASSKNNLRVNFYDVGQGDAVYIRSPENQDIIIDGGPDNIILSKIGRDMPFYDHKIELVILTHPHSDHLSGLIDILSRYDVEQVFCTDADNDSKLYKEWENLISENEISKKVAKRGQQINLGSVKIEILSPEENQKSKDLNDTSIVGRLIYNKTSILFTGDAGQNIEKKLLEQNNKLESDILKVGHHGSKYSSSPAFLSVVKPEYAIISAGKKNRYGHPHKETIDALAKIDAKVFRTDKDGDIKCISDGNKMECVSVVE
jgi:competence protein ComEC